MLALVCLAVTLVFIVIGEARRRPKPIVIAVDGTAASGKGTLAKRLAAILASHIWIPVRSIAWSHSPCWKRAAILPTKPMR